MDRLAPDRGEKERMDQLWEEEEPLGQQGGAVAPVPGMERAETVPEGRVPGKVPGSVGLRAELEETVPEGKERVAEDQWAETVPEGQVPGKAPGPVDLQAVLERARVLESAEKGLGQPGAPRASKAPQEAKEAREMEVRVFQAAREVRVQEDYPGTVFQWIQGRSVS
ncbi:MAG: hypothetical protein AAEJ57_02675, partial [Opitutales bacterium]